MIEINHLTKSYGDLSAIEDLSFSIKKGEVVGFLGPNGAGKSTTMKIITGFMAPTSGTVTVGGFDVFENPIEVKKLIGFLPEHPPVYTDMRVDDYLEFVANLKSVEVNKLKKYVDEALHKMNLTEVRHRIIGNLSKGFRQRVGVAQALVSKPDVLILDEPTVGLDPLQVAEIRHLVKSLAGEHTVVLSTHILPEVQASCERIIIIDRGRIVAEDTIAGLNARLTGSKRVFFKVKRSADSMENQIKDMGGVLGVRGLGDNSYEVDLDQSDDLPEKLAQKVVTSGAGLVEFRNVSLSLEDIFLKLTSHEGVSV